MINWKHVRYFRPHEFDDPDFPGSGEQIDGTLLFALDRLRHQTGWPIRIHREAGGGVDVGGTHGHSPASYHLLAMGARAADWHFETDAPVRIQIGAPGYILTGASRWGSILTRGPMLVIKCGQDETANTFTL